MTGLPVEVRDARVSLGGRAALDGVSMSAHPGQVTAVVGGDGAGKTTLLRSLVGLVALDSGTIGVPAVERVGYLPATTGSWLDLTVQENVEFVGGSYGLSASALRPRSTALLEAAGLEPFRGRLARQLSGGMRRKLGVCLAMLHEPSVLVLDEPSTGVDPVSRVDLWQLAAASAAGGTTVILSTTYLDEAQRASRVVVLERGRSLVEGAPETIVADFDGLITRHRETVRPAWAWRRGRSYREVWPASTPPPSHLEVIPADLEDVVTARALMDAMAGGHR